MQSDFSRSLSLLRQERGVSQRVAAKDLGISQALLSHYENGAREPGLAFVIRACDYYNVSADFLLGRTLSRSGATLVSSDLTDDGNAEGESLPEGVLLANLHKNLLVNSISLLFDLLKEVGRKETIEAARAYLGTGVYKLFRYLYRADSTQNEDFFSVPVRWFTTGISNTDMIYAECDYVESLAAHTKEKGTFPPMSNQVLTERFPSYQSLLQIMHDTGERILRRTEAHRKATEGGAAPENKR